MNQCTLHKVSRPVTFKIKRLNIRTEPGYHLHCTAWRLVLLSHFNIAKLCNGNIVFRPVIFDWLYWKWELKQAFFSIWLSAFYLTIWLSLLRFLVFDHYCINCITENSKNWGKKNKLRTIYPKNHECFTNRKPRIQFYWFLCKKIVYTNTVIHYKDTILMFK